MSDHIMELQGTRFSVNVSLRFGSSTEYEALVRPERGTGTVQFVPSQEEEGLLSPDLVLNRLYTLGYVLVKAISGKIAE